MFGTQFYTEKVYWIFLHFNCSISIFFFENDRGFFWRGGGGGVIWKTGVLKWKKNKRGKTDRQNWLQISSYHLLNYIILSYFLDHFFSTFRHISYHHFEIFFLFFFTCRQIHQLYTKEISFFLRFWGTGGVATFSRGEWINIPAAGIVFFFGESIVL